MAIYGDGKHNENMEHISDWDHTLMDGLQDEPWEEPKSGIQWLVKQLASTLDPTNKTDNTLTYYNADGNRRVIPEDLIVIATRIEEQRIMDAYIKGHEDREKYIFNTQQFKNK